MSRRYVSSLSPSGKLEGFQARISAACLRRLATLFAFASGPAASNRPFSAVLMSLSVCIGATHDPHRWCPLVAFFPQILHRLGGCSSNKEGGCGLPFASRRLLCVRCVGADIHLRSCLNVVQRTRETHSAIGATSCRHAGELSESLVANGAINRHDPSLCSKNHSRRSGWAVIQSKRNESTRGR